MQLEKCRSFITLFFKNPKNGLNALIYKTITIVDFKFKKSFKVIDKAFGFLSKSEAFALYTLAKNCVLDQNILEIGSLEGRSTLALASGAQNGVKVYAVDPHTCEQKGLERTQRSTWEVFLNNTKNFSCIIPIRKYSKDATNDVGKNISLQFIDGWHSENAVDADINNFLPYLAKEFTLVFDDWGDSGVQAGIKKNLNFIPPFLGCVGKMVIFTNNDKVINSLFGKCIKNRTDTKLQLLFRYQIDKLESR